LHSWRAGSSPSLIMRLTVAALTLRAAAASSNVTSPRSARLAVGRDAAVITQDAHARACPAVSAACLPAGAVEDSGDRLIRHLTRASTVTRSTTSASVLQRCWPTRFLRTFKAVWSPPCQRTMRLSASSSRLPTTRGGSSQRRVTTKRAGRGSLGFCHYPAQRTSPLSRRDPLLF
jgi:hypothetical protein